MTRKHYQFPSVFICAVAQHCYYRNIKCVYFAGDFIDALFNMEEECEVDGSRLPPHASLETNQRNLMMSCEIALCKIVNSTK